jgi:hypothetical protein
MSGTFKAALPFVVMAGAVMGLAGIGAKDIAGDIANPGRTDPIVQSASDFAQASVDMFEREQFKLGNAVRNLEINMGRALCACAR